LEFIVALTFGMVIGSFLNVCIYRIPRGLSIVFPPSSCPACGHRLGVTELVPLFSFLALRGKCKNCGKKISWRYPLVELLTGLLFAGSYGIWGLSLDTLKAWIFIGLIIPIALIDLEYKLIPNVLSFPGIIAGLLLSYDHILDAAVGILLGFGVVVLIIVISRGGMGWGDAKLLAMFGAFWGWKVVIYSLFIGSFFGSIIGVILLATHRATRKTYIPFGPYLALGAITSVVLFAFNFPWISIIP